MRRDLRTLRLGYSTSSRELYESLVSQSSDSAEKAPFRTQKDLFLAAACLGAHYNRFSDVATTIKNIPASALDEDSDIPILVALAFQRTNGDLSVLTDAKEVARIAEGWAEGGITLLRELIASSTTGRNPLERLVAEVTASSESA